MCALAAQGRDLPSNIAQKHFPLLNAINLHLSLLTRLQVKVAEAFELVFLCHDS